MSRERPTNAELRIDKIVDDAARVLEESGLLIIFKQDREESDEDAPLARDLPE
jgi:hypothetical protein